KYPVQYSKTVYNIADTYLSLGKIRKSRDDIVTAIEMFSESMKYRGKNSYPFNYALTAFSMGRCYAILATHENKTDNYHKAISLFDEALEIFTEKDYPEMNRKVHEEITAVKKIFFV
ncbi:MAG: tetratricopeptide repeat protein, partial [Ignavibacteria bacterium]|nr:tetratricopeptide repeat protein [Ignavibacteria bacterium]